MARKKSFNVMLDPNVIEQIKTLALKEERSNSFITNKLLNKILEQSKSITKNEGE